MTLPTLVFIPGFWEGPTVYDLIASTLSSAHSYPTAIIPLASTGTAPPHAKTFTDDVSAARTPLQELVASGKEIILVMHSAGAFIGSQAIEGLGAQERKAKGEAGGVRKLVNLTGALFPEGAEHPDQPFFEVKGSHMHPRDPLKTLFNDIPAPLAASHLSNLSFQPATGWDDERISYCGWRHIPSVYLVCEADALLPPAIQRQMAAMVGAEVETCSAGHMVVLSQWEKVVEVVRRAAGERGF